MELFMRRGIGRFGGMRFSEESSFQRSIFPRSSTRDVARGWNRIAFGYPCFARIAWRLFLLRSHCLAAISCFARIRVFDAELTENLPKASVQFFDCIGLSNWLSNLVV